MPYIFSILPWKKCTIIYSRGKTQNFDVRDLHIHTCWAPLSKIILISISSISKYVCKNLVQSYRNMLFNQGHWIESVDHSFPFKMSFRQIIEKIKKIWKYKVKETISEDSKFPRKILIFKMHTNWISDLFKKFFFLTLN